MNASTTGIGPEEKRREQASYKVVEFGRPLQLVCEALEPPQGREVLVRVRACGVCHSDVHMCEGHFDLGGGQLFSLEKVVRPPRTLGHEIVGVIEAKGPEADGEIGAEVLVFPWIGCGECAICARGEEHLCSRPRSLGTTRDGGFSTHVRVPDARYLLPHDGIAPHFAATLACSGLTAYSALLKAGPVSADAPLVIIGAGGVGLAGVALARALHGTGPIVVDIDPAKREAALAAGASRVVDPSEPDAGRALARSTPQGIAAVVDFVGSSRTFDLANTVVGKGGRIVVVGLYGGSVTLPLPLIPMRAVTISGSFVGSLAEMRALLALARDGVLAPLPLTSHPLSSVDAVLSDLKHGRITGRAIVEA